MSLHQPSGRWRLGLALSLTTATFWGCLPVALSLLLQRTDPVTLMGVRFLAAAIFTGLLLAKAGRLPQLSRMGRSTRLLLPIAVLGLAANYYFFQLGVQLTTPGTAQVLIQLSPIMFLVGCVIIFKEKMARAQWIGVGGVCIGLALFFAHRVEAPDIGTYFHGVLAVIIAGVVWAFYALAQKQLLSTMTSQGIMLIVYAFGALMSLPFADFGSLARLDGLGIGLIIFASANTIVAYGAFAEALAHWSASRVSAVLALTPVITLFTSDLSHRLWPDLVPGEHLPPISYVGAAVVVLGSMTASLAGQRRR